MIDVSDLHDWLGNPDEPRVTDLLTALELRAVDIVQTETGRYFGPSTARVEYLCGDGTNVLRLRESPSSVTTVEYRDNVGDAWTVITDTDVDGWELRPPPTSDIAAPASLLRKAGYVWSRTREFRVTYPFGYTAGSEPGDIRQAVMDIVAFLYQERGRQGLRGETIGDHSYSIMAEATGVRSMITSLPAVGMTITRWRGLVYA